MSKKCICSSPSPNFDGTCLTCGKLLSWENAHVWEDTQNQEFESKSVPTKFPDRSSLKADLPYQLKNAANDVVRISRVFKSIGLTLNVLSYIFISLFVLICIILFITGRVSGVETGWEIAIALILWVLIWIQVGLLRGLSAFFLMRGLRELKDLQGN